jgi:hypothetical protein
MPLSAEDIKLAFVALSEELGHQPQRAEIVVVGGAALVLAFGARQSTKDVDAYFVRPEGAILRDAAERVASRLDLPSDWLNDGAKAYLVGVTTGDVVFESSSLIVHAASTPQLLAMKLATLRDAIDRSDASLLLSRMTGSSDEVWTAVRPFVPPPQLDKAFSAFEDLRKALYGAS